MAIQKWIPNYIKRNINYRPKDILTAQEYNALLNLLITQGDYNSSWLEYLQNDAIPAAIAEIGMAEIEEALTVAVREELDALAHEVTNKTSRQLDVPAVTILNTGMQIVPWTDFANLLTAKHLKATYVAATNLIGYSAAYPSLAQLQSIKAAGNDVIAYSTDGATVTAETAATVANSALQYMLINELDPSVFVYPGGTNNTDVIETVHEYFPFAVNIAAAGALNPEGITQYSPATVLGGIPVVKCDNTIDAATIKGYIDNVVENNKYMILQVNTDDETYDENLLEEVLDYMLTHTSIEYPVTIADQMAVVLNTVGNLLHLVDGIAVTEVNGEKYLNW